MTGDLLGVAVSEVSIKPVLGLGTIADQAKSEYIYVQYGEEIDAGEVAIVDADNVAMAITLDLAAARFGDRIGVVAASAQADEYGWLQVRGEAEFQAEADSAANAQLYAGDTAGQIGDAKTVDGALANIVLTEAAATLAGLTEGRLLNPTAGAATGSGGGEGGSSVVETTRAEPVIFYANWADKANQQANAHTDTAARVMQIETADVLINEGGYTVETASGVSEVVIPSDGTYTVHAHVYMDGATGRSQLHARYRHVRGATTTYGIIATGGYLRGTSTLSTDASGVNISQPVECEKGDKITILAWNGNNLSIDLDGDQCWIYLRREEGKLTVSGGGNGGLIVSVHDEHHPPTASEENARNLYMDPSYDPPKLWIPHERPAPSTRASITHTLIAASSAGYRGVAFSAPFPSAAGDFYWAEASHAWRYRAATYYETVGFSELRTQVTLFGDSDVFLNEVTSHQVAADIIENDGDYDSAKMYFYIHANSLWRVDSFTAAVSNLILYDYREITELVKDPVFIYWGESQTARFNAGTVVDRADLGTNNWRLDPSRARRRTKRSSTPRNGAIWRLKTADVSADIDAVATGQTLGDYEVFRLPAGIWDIDLQYFATLGGAAQNSRWR